MLNSYRRENVRSYSEIFRYLYYIINALIRGVWRANVVEINRSFWQM
jgi:hypothetical protein